MCKKCSNNYYNLNLEIFYLHVSTCFKCDSICIVHYYHLREDKETARQLISLGKKQRMLPTDKHFTLLTEDMKQADPKKAMRIQVGDTIYYSKEYQQAKTRNSYTVAFNDNNMEKFGVVLSFLDVNSELYVILKECDTDAFSLGTNLKREIQEQSLKKYFDKQLCPHIVKVSASDTKRVIRASCLSRKCVFMQLRENSCYISKPPNLLEHG